mmetsp:Transcript_27242/g.41435  ORF Transcript_27242/g.41435 Transcript_27242/m.41435 type:complete len:184 (+) Transcript_27242:416-967(+)
MKSSDHQLRPALSSKSEVSKADSSQKPKHPEQVKGAPSKSSGGNAKAVVDTSRTAGDVKAAADAKPMAESKAVADSKMPSSETKPVPDKDAGRVEKYKPRSDPPKTEEKSKASDSDRKKATVRPEETRPQRTTRSRVERETKDHQSKAAIFTTSSSKKTPEPSSTPLPKKPESSISTRLGKRI